MILRVPGAALLLRAAAMERHDLPTRPTDGSVSLANGSDRDLRTSERSRL